MLATDLCALLVVDCTQAKPRCCTNFNSSDNRKVFHLATVHFETALVLVDLAFVIARQTVFTVISGSAPEAIH